LDNGGSSVIFQNSVPSDEVLQLHGTTSFNLLRTLYVRITATTTTTNTTTILRLSGFFLDNMGEPVQEEAFTHTYRGHQSSIICFLHLL